MKKLLFLFLALTLMISCNEEENTPENTIPDETIVKKYEKANNSKWNINGSELLKSIEFNKSGNYIIVKNTTSLSRSEKDSIINNTIIYGTYTVKNDTTFILSDYGTFKIISVNENEIRFSLLSNNKEIELTGIKAHQMVSTPKTELLCKTWKIVSHEEKDLTTGNIEKTDFEAEIIFSKSGTYFSKVLKSNDFDIDDTEGGLSSWKWYDNNEAKIYYSWETPNIWDEDNTAEVTELTENSLIITEYYENEDSESEIVNKIEAVTKLIPVK